MPSLSLCTYIGVSAWWHQVLHPHLFSSPATLSLIASMLLSLSQSNVRVPSVIFLPYSAYIVLAPHVQHPAYSFPVMIESISIGSKSMKCLMNCTDGKRKDSCCKSPSPTYYYSSLYMARFTISSVSLNWWKHMLSVHILVTVSQCLYFLEPLLILTTGPCSMTCIL